MGFQIKNIIMYNKALKYFSGRMMRSFKEYFRLLLDHFNISTINATHFLPNFQEQFPLIFRVSQTRVILSEEIPFLKEPTRKNMYINKQKKQSKTQSKKKVN